MQLDLGVLEHILWGGKWQVHSAFLVEYSVVAYLCTLLACLVFEYAEQNRENKYSELVYLGPIKNNAFLVCSAGQLKNGKDLVVVLFFEHF